MRMIKFRGQRQSDNKWIYGDLMQPTELCDIYEISDCNTIDGSRYDVIKDTVGQYTGLHDKNEKEIYEGDIVQWAGITMEVFWGEDIGIGYGFCWRPCGTNDDYHESMTGFIDEYEVIRKHI